MHVRLKPVYSKLAAPAEVDALELSAKLPVSADGTRWRLSQHQVDTYQALTAINGPDVIFNTAMTGDGKSLAGQLPSLVDGWRRKLFAMYPTNELIRDQFKQAQQTWLLWQQSPPVIEALDSNALDRRMESQDFGQRGAALLSVFNNYDVLLTNPDIFHYIMQAFYVRAGKTGDAADKVFAPMVNAFQQFTFDEFHIFEAPQVVSVVNALLLIDEMTRGQRRQFLFQSATPNPLMLRYLERAGLTVTVVEGCYSHGGSNPDPDKWRQILRGCDLHFEQGTVEQWIEEHLHDTLLPFFRADSSPAKGAIIVNSVAQAKRLVQRLRGEFAKHKLTIGENTGLTSRTQRSTSYDCDLLIGTSTIDVGVDFQINFLLFESRDAGTFLQRLGRLGRHDGYMRDGVRISFGNRFTAYALVPAWTQEALFVGRSKEPPLLVDGMEIDRIVLADAIQSSYPPATTFDNYAQEWGVFQSIRVVRKLYEPLVRSQYEQVRTNLIKRYSDAFRVSILRKVGDYNSLLSEQKTLYDEVTAFRGGTYFDCAVLDEAEEGADQIKTYDLFALIANGNLGALDEDGFWGFVDRQGLKRESIRCETPVAYFRLSGFLPERTRYSIKLKQNVADWDSTRFGSAQALQGIQLHADFPQSIPGYNAINHRLVQRKAPALICLQFHPLQLKRALRLPMLFPLYEFHSLDNLQGAIAFGREALLLHAALKQNRLDCGGTAVIL
jgi:CRISPR-associated endonuclease/helicase Cas3